MCDILLKIFKLEFYHAKPFDGSSLPYSELQGKTCNNLPVIRCYGSSPSGQHLCAHIHGVLPYLYIEYPGIVDTIDRTELKRTLRSLAQRLDAAIASKSGITDDIHVFDILPVKARSIYGYRQGSSTFLKIILINPADSGHAAECLLSGVALGSKFQPFETHIPFLLQFCADYNLQGMNYLEAKAFRMRGARTRNSPLIEANNHSGDPLQWTWTEEFTVKQANFPRQTSTDVEVDISASDIVNNRLEDGSSVNPGLDFLFEEEKARRGGMIDFESQTVPSVPSADDLLPLSGRPFSKETESEKRFLEQFRVLCEELQSAFPSNPPNQLETSSQKSSSLSTISNQALEELCRLAAVAEEIDAHLSQSDHGSSFFNASFKFENSIVSEQASSQYIKKEEELIEPTLLASAKKSTSFCASALFGEENEDEDNLPDFSLTLNAAKALQWNDVEPKEFEEGDEGVSACSSFSDLLEGEYHDLPCPQDSQEDIIESTLLESEFVPQLPQLDGVEDTESSASSNETRRKKRFRLGLRLGGASPNSEPQPELQNNKIARAQPPSTRLSTKQTSPKRLGRRLGVTTANHLRDCRGVVQPHARENVSGGLPNLAEPSNCALGIDDFTPETSENLFPRIKILSYPAISNTSAHNPVYNSKAPESHQTQPCCKSDPSISDVMGCSSFTRILESDRQNTESPSIRNDILKISPQKSHGWSSVTESSSVNLTLTKSTAENSHKTAIIDRSQNLQSTDTDYPFLVVGQDLNLTIMKFPPEDSQHPTLSFEDGPASEETQHYSKFADISSVLVSQHFSYDELASAIDSQEMNLTVRKFPPDDGNFALTSSVFSPEHCNMRSVVAPTSASIILPLTKNLGEPDWNLHSSVHLKHATLVPPSFMEVKNAFAKNRKPLASELPCSKELTKQNISGHLVDCSASISGLWWTSSNQRLSSHSPSNLSISRRAILPVQANHLCLASLELLVRSRHHTTSNGVVSGCKSLQVGRILREVEAISVNRLGGYFPVPQMDPIAAACLSFDDPRHKQPIAFRLVNRALLPDRRQLARILAAAAATDSRGGRTHEVTSFVCENEWQVISWLTFLVQSYDPDLLIGFDVERRSWGFLVERAAKLGKVDFIRDISRLATDLMLCVSCRARIDFCSTIAIVSSCFPSRDQMGSIYCDNIPGLPPFSSCSCGSLDDGSRRIRNRRSDWPAEPGAGRTGGPFACPGRVVLSLWRTLMHEVNLHEYSFESVVFNVLHERTPHFSDGQLTAWFEDCSNLSSQRSLDYWMFRSVANLRLLRSLDWIGRTSEFARVFGIEFFHVLSRGSQYRVESLLLRTAHRLNFLLPSPNVVQRAHQRAPESIPLTLEPISGLHIDGPIAVLDFQSLYPSVAIAYNYCYSTAVGRLTHLSNRLNEVFDFGCLEHHISVEELKNLKDCVTVAPNGVVFVRRALLPGVLPRLWHSLLSSRLMVKDSLKLYSNHEESLKRLLESRQLGLKLIANVMYGYTAASFSGRMPCVEVGDSIVHKGRETLERAIRLVEQGTVDGLQPAWVKAGARVVYGDTDSLFVKFPGVTDRREAFRLAQEIAEAVTNANPAPIKLKLEKIYYPCLLEAKKRYAGYSYEMATQTVPKFDAKGIETVRRDNAPFVGKVLESSLRLLFDQFQTCDQIPDLRLIELKMQRKVRSFAVKLISGRVPFSSCLLAGAYLGAEGYRPGACAPALQVARRLMSVDQGREPLVGERVTYFMAPGRPSETLIGCVRASQEAWPLLWQSLHHPVPVPVVNLSFYLDHQLLPPLRRFSQLIGEGWSPDTWLCDLPRLWHNHQQHTASSSFSQQETLSQRRRPSSILRAFLRPSQLCLGCGSDCSDGEGEFGYCRQCSSTDSRLPKCALVNFGLQMNILTSRIQLSDAVCVACLSNVSKTASPSTGGVGGPCCANLACANLDMRRLTNRDLNRMLTRTPKSLQQVDATESWFAPSLDLF